MDLFIVVYWTYQQLGDVLIFLDERLDDGFQTKAA